MRPLSLVASSLVLASAVALAWGGVPLDTTGFVARAASKQPVYTPHRFVSRPDLKPPKVEVTQNTGDTTPGYYYFSIRVREQGTPDQYGPMIVDEKGELVWFNPRTLVFSSHLRPIDFMGRKALTWWEGRLFPGYGRGEWVVADSAYREIARIKGANGLRPDFHDVRFTDRTVIVVNYVNVNRDLTNIGGARDTNVIDNVVQEIDLRTGEVLFEWSALEHIAFSETTRRPPTEPGELYEWLHLNSIDIDDDGHLLIGARRTNSVFKVNRKTGTIIWRLGGRCDTLDLRPSSEPIERRLGNRCSSFEMGPGTDFVAQHDAQRNGDGTVSIFDNGEKSKGYKRSRGIVLSLDEDRFDAKLRRADYNPVHKLSATQGNFQPLANGGFLAGWGNLPNYTEFDSSGSEVYNATLPDGVNSYRVYKSPWEGQPAEKPAIAARELDNGSVRVYASWNGATDVSGWELLTGPSRSSLESVRTEPRSGFETEIEAPADGLFFQVRARSARGETLDSSKIVGL